jgi:hypothetical protein
VISLFQAQNKGRTVQNHIISLFVGPRKENEEFSYHDYNTPRLLQSLSLLFPSSSSSSSSTTILYPATSIQNHHNSLSSYKWPELVPIFDPITELYVKVKNRPQLQTCVGASYIILFTVAIRWMVDSKGVTMQLLIDIDQSCVQH